MMLNDMFICIVDPSLLFIQDLVTKAKKWKGGKFPEFNFFNILPYQCCQYI